tara:strand:- start:17 stop:418 length:402 start_codon:yes stop_codon:yes gene_type:complete
MKDIDRIKIGDVWYVREDKMPTSIEVKEELELIMSREVMIETDVVLVQGTVLENEDAHTGLNEMDNRKEFSMAALEITFKNSERDTEYWDNDVFLSGVASRQEEHMKEFIDVDKHTTRVAIAVIDKMRELKYI